MSGTSRTDMLLIGGGVASASAAAELRRQGFTGSVDLVTREPLAPYHRPPVTKDLLGPGADRHDPAVYADDWWQTHSIRLRTRSAVASLDVAAHTTTLDDGTVIGYDKALLATGAGIRRLRVDGAALEGIHYLRAPGNAHRLRKEAHGARHAVIVGGSFIAVETAASLTALGMHCTLVMPEPAPLHTAFGPTVAATVAGLLRSRGVDLVCGEHVSAFAGTGRVGEVVTDAGRKLPADLVVVGIGATADARLGATAGLTIGATGGLLCDAELRTSAPDVFAAGDVCEFLSPIHGQHVRVEHERHAQAQGVTAARGMLGKPAPHAEVPYFWTDLSDWLRLEYVGAAPTWDSERIDGSLDDGDFTVWYELAGRVVGALTAGRPADLDRARNLIGSPFTRPTPC
ncbi:FAD-dependent oxidoreductase [Streptomyces sp. DSM 41524]|uniref:FAD-dependent oxidoreductase n=1 Tax=Streptomyces asiaticus subsp. ignotus TaxID=3098222 RepID=A0ABU7QBV0_9ACTN|nr:FAD-dependent oxidoreductase [Streptomyces sp. DSM 41524]